MPNKQKYTARCRGVGDNGTPCQNLGDCARGYCANCYRVVRLHCILNGSWVPRMDIPKPFKPWIYEGNEQALIEMLEKQEREKSEEQQNA